MGMYDTILFRCPYCGKNSKSQTKAGPRILHEYNLHLPISLEEAFEINGTEVACSECGILSLITGDLPGYKVHMLIEEEDN